MVSIWIARAVSRYMYLHNPKPFQVLVYMSYVNTVTVVPLYCYVFTAYLCQPIQVVGVETLWEFHTYCYELLVLDLSSRVPRPFPLSFQLLTNYAKVVGKTLMPSMLGGWRREEIQTVLAFTVCHWDKCQTVKMYCPLRTKSDQNLELHKLKKFLGQN